ncbi:MAG TPA: flagellin [Steroidobacteraceae bacterium]
MSLVLNTNINSLMAQNSLTSSGNQLSTALEQLSSGLRINTAADDAAGYAIVQGMTSQINGLHQASQNAGDGVSLAQTAQGALTEITNDLQTMRDLAVESLNATNSAQDRSDLDQQFQQLSADIDNVAKTASFNGVNLLDGTFNGQTFQIGANAGQTITVASVASVRTSALGESYGASQTGTKLTASTGITGSGQLTINGTDIYAGSNIAGDAKDIAAAISNAGIAGVTATAQATTAVGTYTKADTAAGTGTLTLNGIAISVNVAGVQATDTAAALAAINANSAATGVTAINNGGALTLTASDGRNVTVAWAAGTATASALSDLGLGGAGVAATNYGSYNLAYTGTAGLTIAGSAAAGVSGQAAATLASSATGTAVSNANVLTVSSSNTALSSIDAALQQVAATGAQLGAYQDRFQAAITGLNTDATNLQAARSSIQDTNYAQATSDLSKAQIIQQASTAMVAQANTVPQNVLTLLQKLP